jgi:YVTN family beta-propeller protein
MTNRKHVITALTAAGVLACGGVAIGLSTSSSGHSTSRDHSASLLTSSCHGPTGTAFVVEPGYQAFDAINTANCQFIQDYNVDDPSVPGDSYDTNYQGSAEGQALVGTNLWFAVTSTNNVAVIDSATLTSSNYNPPETLIPVGYNPVALAGTPDGSQVWVIDAGPGTDTTLWSIDVISTSTDTVTGHVAVVGDPTDVAFSPNGEYAYVTTSNGLSVYNVATRQQVALIPGLDSPKSVAVAPNGADVYVAETNGDELATVSTATNQVVHTAKVGQEPWDAVVSPDGSTVYVANPDSDSVSVVDAANGTVENSYVVPGAPDALGVTPNGKQLWVAGNDSAVLYTINLTTGRMVGSTNLGGDGPNSGDGTNPTGVLLTTSTISTGS